MNTMHKYILIFFGLLVFVMGCGIARVSEQKVVPPGIDTQYPQELLYQAAATFNDLTYNATATIKTDGTDNSIGLIVRIRKDSLIWISARKLGFEIARLMMTEDSVWMMDRINGRYFAGDYLFFKQQFNIEVDYNLVEALLLGNPLENWSEEPVKTDCEDVRTCTIRYPERYRINKGRGVRSRPEGSSVTDQVLVISQGSGKILSHTIEIIHENRKITALYDSFISVNQRLIPAHVDISVDNQGVITTINLEVDAFKEGESSGFPFRIPGNFEPMIIKNQEQ